MSFLKTSLKNLKRQNRFRREVFKEDTSAIVHLTITGRCNARCKGCINSTITFSSDQPRNLILAFQESKPIRDATIIKKIINHKPNRKFTVCFYGGEPFLAIEKMVKVRDFLSDPKISNRIRYMVYTNGEFLIDAISRYPEFMKNMWLYSISIDGDEEQHNRIRPGTSLVNIVKNLQALRNIYKGNILMWSTLREDQSLLNCFEEFIELYQMELVNHLFWHWTETYEPFEDFSTYSEKYSQELKKIMDLYVEKILKGELLPIAHINELILYLVTGKRRNYTPCRVETGKNYDITGGKFYACIDFPPGLGELEKIDSLDSLVRYKNWLGCYKCSVHFYCGGRCPVQALVGSKERTRQYCELMKLHVGVVQARISEIIKGLNQNHITLRYIYNHSAFLTRYTDVVP